MANELPLADTSAVVSAEEYGTPQVPKMRSTSFGWWQPILPVSLPLPRFATQPVAPDIGQSSSVVTQKYPSSPGFRSSIPCLDLAVFDSGCSGSVSIDSPVSAVDMDRDVVDQPELGEIVGSGMATTMSRFSALNPRWSPLSSVPHIVVESPTSYEAPVGFKDEYPAADRAGPLLSQESQLSSVQLSTNRVREDYDFDTMDVFPIVCGFTEKRRIFPQCIPDFVTECYEHTGLPVTGSVMNEVTGSFDSAVGSPVMPLSITDYAADLTLLTEPLIPLPKVMLLKPAPVRPNSYPLMIFGFAHLTGGYFCLRFLVVWTGSILSQSLHSGSLLDYIV